MDSQLLAIACHARLAIAFRLGPGRLDRWITPRSQATACRNRAWLWVAARQLEKGTFDGAVRSTDRDANLHHWH
jgi:hypothetical protein